MTQIVLCDDCKPAELIDLCKEFKAGIEVQSFYDPLHQENCPETFEQHNIYLKNISFKSLHGPFGDLCPGSFDPMVREVALNRFELSYSNAAKLNINNIILHAGYVPNTSPPKNYIKRCADLWKKYLETKPNEFYFYIENLFEEYPNFLIELIDQIDDKRVKVCLDIGHAHCHSKIEVVTWIKQLNEKIGYVHLHNNHGASDEHLGLNSGTIPVKDVCRTLLEYSPNAIWALEVNLDSMKSSLEWLKHNKLI